MSIHHFRDIKTYLPKNKTSRDLDHTHLGDSLSSQDQYFSGQPVHNNWSRFYLQPFQRNVTGCKILKWITWPGPRPFQGWSVVRRLTFDIACMQTKLDDSSFSRSTDISRSVKYWSASRGSDHAHLWGSCHLKVSCSYGQTVHEIWSL